MWLAGWSCALVVSSQTSGEGHCDDMGTMKEGKIRPKMLNVLGLWKNTGSKFCIVVFDHLNSSNEIDDDQQNKKSLILRRTDYIAESYEKRGSNGAN